MIKRKIYICVLFLSFLFLFACSCSANSSAALSANENSCIYSNYFDSSHFNINNAELVEEGDYYKVIRSDFMYYYIILDKNHNIVKSDGPLNRQPHIVMADKYLVRFTLQTGTGIGTQWGYYYNIQTGKFSEIFQSIYDQNKSKVAYVNINKVIISDIFNSKKYYYEISSFKNPLSDVAEPITDVKFMNNGASVKISYLSGADYIVVTEIIDLI